jgi:hypothetical protein
MAQKIVTNIVHLLTKSMAKEGMADVIQLQVMALEYMTNII